MSDHDESAEPERANRPYSIDAALELEASLEDDEPTTNNRPISMDTTVLQSLVKSLREDLSRAESQRDEARLQAKEARETLLTEHAGFSETMQSLTERCARLEEEAITAKLKSDADEQSISVLRTKVEESRRGLMRLQSESRRASHQTPPVTGIAALVGTTSKRDKRASFTPLTGSNSPLMSSHRRVSSVADSTFMLDRDAMSPALSNPPSAFTAHDTEPVPGGVPINGTPSASRRFSTMFGGPGSSPPRSVEPAPNTEELESLKKELEATKAALKALQHELAESTEAREASEQCVRALRLFISDAKVGESSTAGESMPVNLPPLPAMTTGEEEDNAQKTAVATASSWGGAFGKLWKVDTSVPKPPVPSKSPLNTSPTLSNKPTPTSTGPPPLTKKFGSFWSSRASISSVSSTTSDSVKPSPSPSVPTQSTMESDTSSVTESVIEPISPFDSAPVDVTVRTSTSSVSSSRPKMIPEEQMQLADTKEMLEPSLSRIVTT